MGMRVTTGMAMNTYRYNLQNSTINMNKARNTVMDHRKFSTFGEDPAAATQAWRVRRAMVNNDIYMYNNKDTYTRFNIAWSALGQASSELTDRDGRKSDIYAASDPTASGRPALGQVLDQTAESVVQTLNSAKSGENFLFAGDDEMNAPFSWDGDKLLYRGVDVNSGGVHKPADDPVPDRWGAINPETGMPSNMPNKITSAGDQAWADYYTALKKFRDDPTQPDPSKTDKNPSTWKDPFKDDTNLDDYGVPKAAYNILKGLDATGTTRINVTDAQKAWAEYYVDQGNLEKLNRMSKEEAPIDLGMGMLEDDNGKLVDGTYYNRSLPGINMLGFGIDEDGDPKNVCMIMKRLGEIYKECNPDSGSYDYNDESGTSEKAEAVRKEAIRLLDKLKAGQSYVSEQHVEVNAKSSFLQQNESRLELQGNYLDEQRAELEDVDLAQAISQFSWDYYCYSAALKVGTQLLSQSLIDYMS